jgi:membrane fusion protein (multidrug efflux system)
MLALVPALSLLLGGCGMGSGHRKPESAPPLVAAALPTPHVFVERIDAVGTARANEQVTLASSVTERIEKLYFDDGGFVQKGQIVARLAQGQQQASLDAARAAQQQAEAQLRRVQALSERGFATGSTLDQQVALARRARSDADSAQAQIADRVIRAPFAGQVSLRLISEGAIAGAGTAIATISDVSRIKLDFTVPETALAVIRPGQPIAAVAAAYPATPFAGRITRIDPVIDPSSRAVTVRAILPNPGNRLKPGMLLTVGIEAGSHQAPAVPELAVIGDGADRYVFVLGPGDKAVRTRVTTGLRDQGLVEVRGVPPGARVIGEGVVKVADGTVVRLQGARSSGSRGKGARQ